MAGSLDDSFSMFRFRHHKKKEKFHDQQQHL
jgi:hypothetical protein